MKKVILSICFLFAAVSFVSAQQGQGQSPERIAQMKQAFKDSLGLTDAQAQSVLDVQTEFRPKRQELRNASEAERPAKMKEINDAMAKRLAEVLKDGALAQKVIDYNTRHQGGRGGGNRPPGQ